MSEALYIVGMSMLNGVLIGTLLGALPITPADAAFWVILVGGAVFGGVLIGGTAP